jgi:uncharacterized protein YrrD
MEMQFKKGAGVFTSEDKKVGTIDRVVMDPQTKEITHLVVQKGFLFTEDKVLPLDLVSSATGDRITLQEDVDDVQAFPDFKKTHYIPVSEGEAPTAPEEGDAALLYWYPPTGMTWWGTPGYVPYPKPLYVARTERHIPEGTVALEEGAKAISKEGEHVGNVERVFTNPKGERATHLVISRGLLLKERKLVPTAWVTRVGEDQIHLTVGSSLLNTLPDYQPS